MFSETNEKVQIIMLEKIVDTFNRNQHKKTNQMVPNQFIRL